MPKKKEQKVARDAKVGNVQYLEETEVPEGGE